jgi:hypothetical protein
MAVAVATRDSSVTGQVKTRRKEFLDLLGGAYPNEKTDEIQ